MAKKDGGGGELDFKDENLYMEAKIKVLQSRLMLKDEQTSNSRKNMDALRQRTEELDKAFQDEADRRRENTSEMSRQYREMQESFNERIEVLQQNVAEAKQEIETVTREIERARV